MTHHMEYKACPAEGCDCRIGPAEIMCSRHWKKVPREVKCRVYEKQAIAKLYPARAGEFLEALRQAALCVRDREQVEQDKARQLEWDIGRKKV
jgi:hypothetical protein